MNIQLSMWKVYASHIMNTPHMLTILIVGALAAVVFYILFRKAENIKRKVLYLYAHIFFLFSPLISTAILWKCAMPVYSCSPKIVIYLLSAGAGITMLLSFITLPYLYSWASKSQEIKDEKINEFVQNQSKAIGMRKPKLYAIHEFTPHAYSITNIRPSIFLSVGLFELLDKKEREAVLLHELYHIQKKSSFWKFSINMLKVFSPLALFVTVNESMDHEEKEADSFAVRTQGTKRFLNAAKYKINNINRKIVDYSKI